MRGGDAAFAQDIAQDLADLLDVGGEEGEVFDLKRFTAMQEGADRIAGVFGFDRCVDQLGDFGGADDRGAGCAAIGDGVKFEVGEEACRLGEV